MGRGLKSACHCKPLFRMNLVVAIVDDEQHCTDRIIGLLNSYGDRIQFVCFDTADEAIKGINVLRPNVVFLDVELRDKTGFDVLSSLEHRDFCLIFTTAFQQYAIDAFKFSAIDYLLKPIAKDDFDTAMQKAFRKVEQEQLNEKINVLLSHISKESGPKKITLPSREGYTFINIPDIIRCEADVNYTHIYTSDGKKHTVSKPLKHLESLLMPHGFYRIHSANLINLEFIKSYTKSGYVTLLDNTQLEISVRKKDGFIKMLNDTSRSL